MSVRSFGSLITSASATVGTTLSVAGTINSAGATGDLLLGNGTTMAALTIGTNGQYLAVSGGTAVWQDTSNIPGVCSEATVISSAGTGGTATVATIATTTDSVLFVTAEIVGIESANGDTASYKLHGKFENDAGTVTQLTPQDKLIFEDDATWDAELTVSGTNVIISVTGEAANRVDWRACYSTIVQVSA